MYNLNQCSEPAPLHYTMLKIFANTFSDIEYINAIRESFFWMDEDKNGVIDTEELRKAYHLLNQNIK